MAKTIIDPGHGGKDPGSVNTEIPILEKDLTLMISQYQQKRFKELGIDVAMTRERDISLSNAKRTQIVRNSGARVCISNHLNSVGKKDVERTEIIHSVKSNGRLANIIKDELCSEGITNIKVFCKESNKVKGNDYYFMHRQTGSVETIIVEYEFLSNTKALKRFLERWQVYAEAVVRGVCRYLRMNYSKKEVVKVDNNNQTVSDWAKDGWDWAKKNKITDGERPKDNMTREEMVTMLYRYDKLKK